MKKHLLSFFVLLFVTVFAAARTLRVDGVEYTVDTLQNHQVGPGTDFIQLSMFGGGVKRLSVYFLKTDLKNEHTEIRTTLGRDSIYTGERPSEVAKRKSTEGAFYFAGTNGDFYATAGYVGYPNGGSMVDSEIARIPREGYNLFAIDDEKFPDAGAMTYYGKAVYKGAEWEIHSVNHLRETNQLVLYNRHNGQYTRTNPYGTEALIELLPQEKWGVNRHLKAKVLKVERGVGAMEIPDGKAVLSGHGTSAELMASLAAGDEIEIRLDLTLNGNTSSDYTAITGSDWYNICLKEGVIEQDIIWNEYHPRTAIGYNQSRDTLIFCVIDGRNVSIGATTKGVAELMQSAGAYTAANMDGGGSSCMYLAEYGKQVNRGSDGSERAVSNCIFIVSNAPTDHEVASIKPHQAKILLPRFGECVPLFRSYNQYGVLLESDQQGVVLTCPEAMGTIVGNKFIATGTGEGVITATYNGTVKTEITVGFIPATGLQIRLDSVIVSDLKPYEIEVTALTANGELAISPGVMNWTVEDDEICVVENGVVKGLKTGRTKLTGDLDGVHDEILVLVEIPETSPRTEDRMIVSEWTLNASSFLNAELNELNRPTTWEHGSVVNFTGFSGRAPSVKLQKDVRLFGLPDTVRVTLNIGNLKIDRALLYLYANNGDNDRSREFKVFEQEHDFSLDIPVSDLFDTSDRGIYPLIFSQMQFHLSAAEMVKNSPYSLAVKGVECIYNGFGSGSGVESVSSSPVLVYPNPLVGEKFYVRLDSSSPVDAQLYGLSGQRVFSGRYLVGEDGLAEIPAKDLPQGTYLLRLYQDERVYAVKIVK